MGKFFGLEIHNVENYKKHRKIVIELKSGAVSCAFDELNGIVNISKFSERFLERTHSWFSQRLNGCVVMNRQMSFKEDEYKRIAEGFRELAKELMQHADEIDSAEMD